MANAADAPRQPARPAAWYMAPDSTVPASRPPAFAMFGATEIACGTLVLLGLFTRLAVIPLLGVMAVAIVSTKIPILLGEDFWGFQLKKLPDYGLWAMAQEARTDFAMTLGSAFLLVVGAGPKSLDQRLASGSTEPA